MPTLVNLEPRYVTNEDFESYVEGWTTTNAAALTRLLARAERYIDYLGSGRPICQIDCIQQLAIKFTTPPTGGYFTTSFTFQGVAYTSGKIPYNALYYEVENAINESKSAASEYIPQGVQTYEGPLTPFIPSGPLPFQPVVLAFTQKLGAAKFEQGTVAFNGLTGGTNVTPEVQLVCPGGPWGGRFNPSYLLEFNQLERLKSAVCAQAEYMYNMGPRFFVEEQYSEVKGPDFTTKGKLPKIAPKARRELSLAGLITSMARSRP